MPKKKEAHAAADRSPCFDDDDATQPVRVGKPLVSAPALAYQQSVRPLTPGSASSLLFACQESGEERRGQPAAGDHTALDGAEQMSACATKRGLFRWRETEWH
jgi:hypothetical protein